MFRTDWKFKTKEFCKYFVDELEDRFLDIVNSYGDAEVDFYEVIINFLEMEKYNKSLAESLEDNPRTVLPLLNFAAQQAQKHFLKKPEVRGELKENVHVRIGTLPDRFTISNVLETTTAGKDKLVSITGTVISVTRKLVLEFEKEFKCPSCKKAFRAQGEPEYSFHVPPQICKNRSCRGKRKGFLQGTCIRTCDYQEIKIQDQVSQVEVGNVPRSLKVILLDDLVGKFNAGEQIMVNGLVVYQWPNRPTIPGSRPSIEQVIYGNHIEVTSQKNNKKRKNDIFDIDPEEVHLKSEFEKFWEHYKDRPFVARDIILRSVCPQLFGMYIIKLALMLTLIGGNSKSSTYTNLRGHSHLLLVGDPGTGKSQFLKYATKLATRGVLTTGVGSTNAGLTVMAKKDRGTGDYVLEAGALVLANGGVCCIDEFDSIREKDRSTIHEAMEQQTLSVAKAGLVCKLATNTTVIAACNPKGKFDVEVSLAQNTALSPPLLSRFDLIFVCLDCKDENWDSKVSDFILNGYKTQHHVRMEQSKMTDEDDDKKRPRRDEDEEEDEEEEDVMVQEQKKIEEEKGFDDADGKNVDLKSINLLTEPIWPLPVLQKYIKLVREKYPNIPKEHRQILVNYWKNQRKQGDEDSDYFQPQDNSRTTTRMLESLIRLAQAHAKLMFRDVVSEQDVIVACVVMDASFGQTSLLDIKSVLHGTFPKNPDKVYKKQRKRVLRTLGIKTMDDEDEDENEGEGNDDDDDDEEDDNFSNRIVTQRMTPVVGNQRVNNAFSQLPHWVTQQQREEEERRRNSGGRGRDENFRDGRSQGRANPRPSHNKPSQYHGPPPPPRRQQQQQQHRNSQFNQPSFNIPIINDDSQPPPTQRFSIFPKSAMTQGRKSQKKKKTVRIHSPAVTQPNPPPQQNQQQSRQTNIWSGEGHVSPPKRRRSNENDMSEPPPYYSPPPPPQQKEQETRSTQIFCTQDSMADLDDFFDLDVPEKPIEEKKKKKKKKKDDDDDEVIPPPPLPSQKRKKLEIIDDDEDEDEEDIESMFKYEGDGLDEDSDEELNIKDDRKQNEVKKKSNNDDNDKQSRKNSGGFQFNKSLHSQRKEKENESKKKEEENEEEEEDDEDEIMAMFEYEGDENDVDSDEEIEDKKKKGEKNVTGVKRKRNQDDDDDDDDDNEIIFGSGESVSKKRKLD